MRFKVSATRAAALSALIVGSTSAARARALALGATLVGEVPGSTQPDAPRPGRREGGLP